MSPEKLVKLGPEVLECLRSVGCGQAAQALEVAIGNIAGNIAQANRPGREQVPPPTPGEPPTKPPG